MNTITQRGFSLLETAVVLIILSLLAGAGLNIAASQAYDKKLRETEERMNAIDDALLTYRQANGRIPCPADRTLAPSSASYGAELGTPGDGNCTGALALSANGMEGGVPTKTLSLPDEYMMDGWGRKFTYAVDKRMTATNSFTTYPITTTGLTELTVKDATGANRGNPVALIISHGVNGHGAYLRNGATRQSTGSTNTDELNNCNCTNAAASGTVDANYVQKSMSEDGSNALNSFDDIVRYHMRWELFSSSEVTLW